MLSFLEYATHKVIPVLSRSAKIGFKVQGSKFKIQKCRA
jgi:hypothetical protein